MTQMTIDYATAMPETSYLVADELQIVRAELADADAIVALFGALHSYNASLDGHFVLSDDWEGLLRQEFCATLASPDHMWLLVKDGDRAVGLLIAAIHTDSPMFRHRRWVEVEGLYVASGYRRMGIAQRLLDRAYRWAEARGLVRVQLYVTASNMRAQSVYIEQGFAVTQAIMRKSL